MSSEMDAAKRILEAKYGRAPKSETPPSGNLSNEEFVVISVLGDAGIHAQRQLEAKCGPLEGRAAGMFHPCRLESRADKIGCFYLFSLPQDIVPRARLRVEQGWVAEGFGVVIKAADPSEFKWVGGDAEEKQKRGVVMDAYPPPQLSYDWIMALIEKPALQPLPKPSVSAPASVPLSVASKPAASSQSPVTNMPKGFSLRAVGSAGKQSLTKLEKRFGMFPAQLKIGGPQKTVVFTVTPEAMPGAIAALGEIAPGLWLEAEHTFTPNAGFARMATAWLNDALAVRGK
jgi:hypothetical protein